MGKMEFGSLDKTIASQVKSVCLNATLKEYIKLFFQIIMNFKIILYLCNRNYLSSQ